MLTRDEIVQISTSSSTTTSTESLSHEIESYQKQLENLTSTVDSLLEGLDNIEKEVNEAQDSQEKLYSAHHKVINSIPIHFNLNFLFFSRNLFRSASLKIIQFLLPPQTQLQQLEHHHQQQQGRRDPLRMYQKKSDHCSKAIRNNFHIVILLFASEE